MQKKRIIYFNYFFSGIIYLALQVIWQRQIFLKIGATIYSVSLLLSAWMLGLAIGSFIISKFSEKIKNPIKTFYLSHILIVLYGFLMFLLFFILGKIDYILLNHTGKVFSFISKALVLFFIVCIPTVIMGGSLPLLSMTIKKEKLAYLYSINALGSVIGAILTGFVFLRVFGTLNTYLIISISGIIVFGLGFFLSKKNTIINIEDISEDNNIELSPLIKNILKISIPFLFLISGFTSLSYEVIYNRILIYFTGNNTYCFTIITALFILGISAGSLLYGIVRKKINFDNKIFIFFIIELFICFWHIIFPTYSIKINSFGLLIKQSGLISSVFSLFLSRFSTSFFLIFPVVFSFGFLFPLVVDIYKSLNKSKIEKNVGLLYTSNTIGSVIGPIFTGFFLIGLFELSKTLRIISLLNLTISGILLIVIILKIKKLLFKIIIFLLFISVFLLFLKIPYDIVISKMAAKTKPTDEILYFKDGVFGTVSVTKRINGIKHLKINGVGEVPTDYNSIRVFRLLAYLPFTIKDNIQSVLTIAFGGGITYGSIISIDSVKTNEVIEICSDVKGAAPYFSEWNHNVLDNKKCNIIIDDGRRYVQNINKKYDLIVSDSTHPISSDSWVLYTKEFYDSCKNKLNKNGIFAQWLPIHQISLYDYKIILRTISSSFSETALFYCNEYTVIIGWDNTIEPNNDAYKMLLQNEIPKIDLANVNLRNIDEINSTRLFNTNMISNFTGNGPIAKDDKSPIQFAETRSLGIGTRNEIIEAFIDFLEKEDNPDNYFYQISTLKLHNLFYMKKYNEMLFYIDSIKESLLRKGLWNSEMNYQLNNTKEAVSYNFCFPEVIQNYLQNPTKENIKEIDKLSNIMQDDNNIQLLRGILYYKDNRWNEALEVFLQSHRREKSPDTFSNVIIILRRMGRHNEADVYLNQARTIYGKKWGKGLDK